MTPNVSHPRIRNALGWVFLSGVAGCFLGFLVAVGIAVTR